MKIFYHNRLVDISGFHQAAADGQKLVISYPTTPKGRVRFPDEFVFSNKDSAVTALNWISQYCHSDRIVEFVEGPGGKFVACAYPFTE